MERAKELTGDEQRQEWERLDGEENKKWGSSGGLALKFESDKKRQRQWVGGVHRRWMKRRNNINVWDVTEEQTRTNLRRESHKAMHIIIRLFFWFRHIIIQHNSWKLLSASPSAFEPFRSIKRDANTLQPFECTFSSARRIGYWKRIQDMTCRASPAGILPYRSSLKPPTVHYLEHNE